MIDRVQVHRLQDGSLTASFVYNAEGLRVQKTVNGVVTKYILHGKNITHLIRGNDELHFFYDASGSPAMVEWNHGTTTAKYAYVKNLQGDIIAILDDAGAEVVKYTYDAWGKTLNTTGTLVATLGVLNPFRYRGYVCDEETGLYYLRSRYYNSMLSRFISVDSILASYRVSLFEYCGNSPVSQFDEDGRDNVSAEQKEALMTLFQNGFVISTHKTISMNTKSVGDKETISLGFFLSCDEAAEFGSTMWEKNLSVASLVGIDLDGKIAYFEHANMILAFISKTSIFSSIMSCFYEIRTRNNTRWETDRKNEFSAAREKARGNLSGVVIEVSYTLNIAELFTCLGNGAWGYLKYKQILPDVHFYEVNDYIDSIVKGNLWEE